MGKYIFVYRGGSGMAEDAAAQEQVMAAWGTWFGQLGPAIVDGGAPFGASTSVTASGSGGETAGMTGYTIVSADSLDAAADLAKGCPVLSDGGTVDVYDCIDMS